MVEKELRIIKKYPNRRLYDTHLSQYITLKEVDSLLSNHQPFKVVDNKTGQDLTHSILLQIIIYKEEHSQPILTSDLLKSIIEFYEDPMHSMLGRYLEHSIAVFRDHQVDLQSPLSSLQGSKTQLNTLHDLAEDSLKVWSSSSVND